MKLLFFGTLAAFVIVHIAVALFALLNYRRSGRGGVK